MVSRLLLCFCIFYWPCLFQVLAQDCKKGENVTLEEGLVMKCKKGKWKLKGDRAAANPGAPPCEDNPSVSCAVQNGNCNQYTQKGIDMDRDCPGTCGKFYY